MSDNDLMIVTKLKHQGIRLSHFGLSFVTQYRTIESVPIEQLKSLIRQKVPDLNWEKILHDNEYTHLVAAKIWAD